MYVASSHIHSTEAQSDHTKFIIQAASSESVVTQQVHHEFGFHGKRKTQKRAILLIAWDSLS